MLAMGYLATGKISENMLQLKRFDLYFKGIINTKWLFSYRNNDISYRDARGFGSMLPEKFFNTQTNFFIIIEILFTIYIKICVPIVK